MNWNKFSGDGESKDESFEKLCTYIFFRELKVNMPSSYLNQKAIETEPVLVNGEKYGFQAKFFEGTFKWEVILSSFESAIKTYKDIQQIWFYSNKRKTNKSKGGKGKHEKAIDKLAKDYDIKVLFITDEQILLKVKNQYPDLAQFYFGEGDYVGFKKNNLSLNTITFLHSKEYIELKLTSELDMTTIFRMEDLIKQTHSDSKLTLVKGNPGSGKSILTFKILDFLNNQSSERLIVPLHIQLRDCHNISLEQLIRSRLSDYNILPHNNKLIYIFDGFDEVHEFDADFILNDIYKLEENSQTVKIIITSRKSNKNIFKLRSKYDDMIEYTINDLEIGTITRYFEERDNKLILDELLDSNPAIISEIKDVLLLKLLYQSIDSLNEYSTIFDLFRIKINQLMENNQHNSNLESLNILMPKNQKIIQINEEISVYLYKERKLVISLEELYRIIIETVDKQNRLNYNDINTIANYILRLFFENNGLINARDLVYTYQHRRYQEYFLTRKLKEIFDCSPLAIRKMRIIQNSDYFENFFLKYLRQQYIGERNFEGIISLNLIEVYLGKNPLFKTNEMIHLDSDELIYALVHHDEEFFDSIINDDFLNLNSNLILKHEVLDHLLSIWADGYFDSFDTYKVNELTKSYVMRYLSWGVALWKCGKEEYSKIFFKELNKIEEKLNDNLFLVSENIIKFKEGFFKESKNWFYYRLIICNCDLTETYNSILQEDYEYIENCNKLETIDFEVSNVEYVLKNFFKVCLDEFGFEKILILLTKENIRIKIVLFNVLKEFEYIKYFLRSTKEQKELLKIILSEIDKNYIIQNNFYYLVFFKKYLKLAIDKDEIDFIKSMKKEISLMDRFSINCQNKNRIYSLLAFILDDYSLEQYCSNTHESFDEVDLSWGFYSALFMEYLNLIDAKTNFKAIYRDYIRHLSIHSKDNQLLDHFEREISILWANIFAETNENNSYILNELFKPENRVSLFYFYKELNIKNKELFNSVISFKDLQRLDDSVYNSNVEINYHIDNIFTLSRFYVKRDKKNSIEYFEKGLTEGILRHNIRKDTVISYYLIDSFELLVESELLLEEQFNRYADKIFLMTLRVKQITDGKQTWHSPYSLINVVAKVNIKKAEALLEEVVKLYGKESLYNKCLKNILFQKMKTAIPYEELKSEIENKFYKYYTYDGTLNKDYYEYKFITYILITKYDFYTFSEKKEAFVIAYNLIEELNNKKNNISLSDYEFNDIRDIYLELCNQYSFDVIIKDNNNDEDKNTRDIVHFSELELLKQIENSENEEDLLKFYSILNDISISATLTEYKSWEILINKTYEIFNSIQPFIQLLKDCNYPNPISLGRNTEHLHIGVAVCFNSTITHDVIYEYFLNNSGYYGFYYLIKVFVYLENEEMCKKLFERYYRICELLVY